MGTRLYVGNLSYDVTAEKLKELFSASGEVVSADLITDRQTGRSKGFGFVEMASDEAATAAIEALNNTDLDGRKLTVNEAKPRTERTTSGGGGGFNSGYSRRY